MANNLQTGSAAFSIDTANTTTDLVANTLFRARALYWTGANTAGHVLEIRNSSNQTMFKAHALGNNHFLEAKPTVSWRGLVIYTLGSGTLIIEHD